MDSPSSGAWPPAPLNAGEQDRLVALLDSLSDGFVVFDARWRFVWVNRAGAALLRRPAEELIGRCFWSEFARPEQTVVFAQFHLAVAEQREVSFELFDAPLAGWFEVRATPTGTGLVATYRDITERRRGELLLAGNLDALTAIAENAPLTDVLDAVTAMVETQSEHGAHASVLLVSADGQRLVHGSAPSLPAAYNQAIDGVAIGPAVGSCGTAAYRREQVVVEDISTDPLWEQWREPALAAGLRACWSTPVFAADGTLLATFATYYDHPRSPGPADQQLIEQVTRTVAVAIQHDRGQQALQTALAAAQHAAARSHRLEELAVGLSAALVPEQVAEICTDYALEALSAQAGWLAVLDADGGYLELACAAGFPPDLVTRFARVPLDADLPMVEVARTGTPRWMANDAEVRVRFASFAEVHPEVGSVALLPLRTEGRTIGVLLLYRDCSAQFDADERGEAVAVAAQCAQALRRAGQFATSHQLAEIFQRSLLTDPPQPGELEIAVRYHPAVDAAEVGGDWYDAFALPDGCLGVVIGDVVGHDLPAAATMGQLRSMLRTLACDSGGSPAEVLARLDRLNERLRVTEFTTLVFAKVVGPVGGPHQLHWANAGHPPPLLFLADGSSRLLDGVSDLVLGVDPDSARADAVVTLPPGSTLLLYTDGLVEARDQPFDEGVSLLRGLAAKFATAVLEEFCDAVLGFVHDPADDVALLAVRIPAQR